MDTDLPQWTVPSSAGASAGPELSTEQAQLVVSPCFLLPQEDGHLRPGALGIRRNPPRNGKSRLQP